jgi:uncharacterized protein YndB with AHSA1/START domain
MATVKHTIDAAPADVFRILTTPETYPEWLIGCDDIRSVDRQWPQPGSAFHHRVGIAGPLTVADSTKVIEIQEPNQLVLEARARPFGRAMVTFTLRSIGDGRTEMTFAEVPLGHLAPLSPLLDRLSAPRNRRSLERLAEVAAQTMRVDRP